MDFGPIASAATGGLISALGNIYTNNQNIDYAQSESNRQYDLARNSIKYKVQDAKNAGIHPLYALGGQTMGSTVSTPQINNPLAELGQNVSNIKQQQIGSKYDLKMESLAKKQAMENITGQQIANQKATLELKQLLDVNQNYAQPQISHISGGRVIYKSPRWSDAQIASDRQGDIIEQVHGIGTVSADTLYTNEVEKTYSKQWQEHQKQLYLKKQYRQRK